jgi:porin
MGTRLLVNITDRLSVLGGIFDGNQAGPGPGDPQERNRYGVNFRINDPPLLLGQIQYAWNNKKGDPNLTRQIKFGGWRHFGPFSDLQLASNGVSLAAPTSSGTPLVLAGISEDGQSSSSRSIACPRAMTGELACSLASRVLLPTAI